MRLSFETDAAAASRSSSSSSSVSPDSLGGSRSVNATTTAATTALAAANTPSCPAVLHAGTSHSTSAAIAVIQALTDAGAVVTGYDPEGMDNARHVIDGIAYADSPYAAAEGADVLVIVTEWNEFRALNLPKLKSLMNTPVLVDLRNIYQAGEVTKHGFSYTSVGRSQ